MAIHLYVLCREFDVGYQAPDELVVLNDLTCASPKDSPIMRQVSELLDVEGPLCECWNAVLLALKHEQYVRAGDGYDLRTEYAIDVKVKVDAIVARTTSSVQKFLLLVCAVAYDFNKRRDRVSCIKLQDQEQQVTARNGPPSKKTRNNPGHIPGAHGGGGGGSSVVDKNHETGMSGAPGAAIGSSAAVDIQPALEATQAAEAAKKGLADEGSEVSSSSNSEHEKQLFVVQLPNQGGYVVSHLAKLPLLRVAIEQLKTHDVDELGFTFFRETRRSSLRIYGFVLFDDYADAALATQQSAATRTYDENGNHLTKQCAQCYSWLPIDLDAAVTPPCPICAIQGTLLADTNEDVAPPGNSETEDLNPQPPCVNGDFRPDFGFGVDPGRLRGYPLAHLPGTWW
jgi:hypothetical protein